MKALLLALAAALSLAFATPPAAAAAAPRTLIVSTAASLTDAFDDLARIFEKENAGVKVDLNLGASNVLARQIEQGAPADVFASADQETMDALDKRGLIADGTRKDFARNAAVLVVPKSGIRHLTWKELPAHPSVYRVAVGDEGVPIGRYTRQIFAAVGIEKAIKHKLVPGSDVRQVLTYVNQGEVEAAVVYASDAAASKGRVRIVDRAPPRSHEPIVYPIAAVKAGDKQELAKKWIALVLSPDGQKILEKRGFIPVDAD